MKCGITKVTTSQLQIQRMQTIIKQHTKSSAWTTYLKDARHFQIVYLASFLILGILFLHWDNDLPKYGIIILSAIVFQQIGVSLTTKKKGAWKSALITSLGLCLLCKTNGFETGIFASFIAISTKFLIRFKGKHVFNPVNIGIVATILLTQDAWISPGQWGSHLLLLFTLGVLGFLVLTKVDRIDASLTFLFVFGGLQFIRSVLYLGWSFDVFFHQIASGTLLLFTFFMITDPMTTPNHRGARILWVSLIGIASFILSNYMYVYAAPIWVLFFAAPLTPLFDTLWQAEKFEWNLSKSIIELKK